MLICGKPLTVKRRLRISRWKAREHRHETLMFCVVLEMFILEKIVFRGANQIGIKAAFADKKLLAAFGAALVIASHVVILTFLNTATIASLFLCHSIEKIGFIASLNSFIILISMPNMRDKTAIPRRHFQSARQTYRALIRLVTFFHNFYSPD